MDIYEASLAFHKKHQGKIALASKVPVTNREELSLAYTPGVAEPCRAIAKDPEAVWDYTSRRNWVAVITDGSAVLGLGDIGPAAGMPVMEGKCVLFKEFSGLDAFPLAIRSQDIDTFVETVKLISLSFGAVNLEDIAAPRCFEIEERLKAELDIPVMHDDQHGTAMVVTAGLINALKLTGRTFEGARIVIAGAGAAGVAISNMLLGRGVKDLIVCDSKGIVGPMRTDLNPSKEALRSLTNPRAVDGSLADAMAGADVFIGVSAPGIVTEEMIRSMAKDAIVFALSNPTPEVMPEVARAGGARVIATGRSDFPNQVNNVLAYPGVFKGTLKARAKQITEEMKYAAADALAAYVTDVSEEKIIPDVLDKRVADVVADAVAAVCLK